MTFHFRLMDNDTQATADALNQQGVGTPTTNLQGAVAVAHNLAQDQGIQQATPCAVTPHSEQSETPSALFHKPIDATEEEKIKQELEDWVNTPSVLNKHDYQKATTKILTAFKDRTIQELDFASYQFASLPNSIGKLNQLEKLSITHTPIALLPDSIGDLTKLTKIHLHNNRLMSLPDSIGNLGQLTKLFLWENPLAVLPNSIGNLIKLTTLDLDDNQLALLPNSIGNLTQLKTLNLQNNKLTLLPNSIGNLTQLETLNLPNNKLTSLPDTLGNLPCLTTLFLEGNQLKFLPNSIGNLTELTGLYLDENQLTLLPNSIGKLKKLTWLQVESNQLRALPDAIGDLIQLTYLALGCNQLTSVPPTIWNLFKLKMLDFQENQLTTLADGIGNLTQLTYLDLESNQLSTLPDSIGNLQQLETLNLQFNRFTHVPRVLFNLPVNTEILLQDNPLPDDEIRAVRAEMQQRRANGLPVPQLVLPKLAEDEMPDNALRLAAEYGLNVHTAPLTNAFKARLDELAAQFPNDFTGDDKEQRAQLQKIEERLLTLLNEFGKDHAYLNTALNISRNMFKKAYGQQAAVYNDFKYASGRVLAYVLLAMEAQWHKTPEDFLPAAKQNGAELLMNFMKAGKDFCDTRHIEEVLQMINLPLSEYAQQYPELTSHIKAVAPSESQLRDLVLPIAEEILQQLVQKQPLLKTENEQTTLQHTWRKKLEQAIQHIHPAIKNEQLNTFVQNHIVTYWNEFVETALALPKNGSPQTNSTINLKRKRSDEH